MELDLIRARLEMQDQQAPRELAGVDRLVGYRGGGMFHSHNFRIIGDDARYITKFPSHEQQPAHTLFVELAVARLGQLFDPPLTPRPAILDIRPEHVAGVSCGQAGCPHLLEAGLAFGSREVPDVVEFRGGASPAISASAAARIVVFQTWLQGGDTQILLGADEQAYSMDHANYLQGGYARVPENDPDPAVSLVCISGLDGEDRLRSQRVFASTLQQLELLPEEQIVDAFGGIPTSWWGPLEVRMALAQYALARKPAVAATVAALWR